MAGSVTSFFTSVPATSQLNAPTQIQGLGERLPSTDVDWTRLLDYKEPTGIHKRGFTSWIYLWG
jgi:hypothetical protein